MCKAAKLCRSLRRRTLDRDVANFRTGVCPQLGEIPLSRALIGGKTKDEKTVRSEKDHRICRVAIAGAPPVN